MKLLIDNFDGQGGRDYSGLVDACHGAKVARGLNAAASLSVSILSGGSALLVPLSGARVSLTRDDGSNLFTGHLTASPSCQYLGWDDHGPIYRYDLLALSDVALPNQKVTPLVPSFVARAAGDALRQLTQDTLPGWFDLTGIEPGDTVPFFDSDAAKSWATSAAEIALYGRCSFRDDDGKLFFNQLAQNTYALSESDPTFSPDALQLRSVNRVANDLTVLGQLEPAAHVKDYFAGDGYTTTFYLSQIPFTRGNQIAQNSRTILNEEYTELDPTHWVEGDPQHAITVSNGQLEVAGGTGTDGQTCLNFVEKIELGGATVLEHGDVLFNGASDGVIGGLYAGPVSIAGCLAGFRVTSAGTNCNIQALVSGALTGMAVATQPGHHYIFTTQFYPTEVYRMQQVYHSSTHPSGSCRGGDAVACDVRVVLEVQDIDPTNPATQVAPATVLFDGVVSNAPGFCTYSLVNALNMQCSVTFTYIFLPIDALVRTTLPQGTPTTTRTGSLLAGAECRVSNSPTLQFYPSYVPAANELIEVSYRGQSHATARVINGASIAALRNGADDGVRGALRHVAMPTPRTSGDCEIAALALLDDAGQGWTGEYRTWGQFLPGGANDVYPGDGLAVSAPSRHASFLAIIREMDLVVLDIASETVSYTLRFVDAGDPSLDFTFASAAVTQMPTLTAVDVTQVGNVYLADLTGAAVTNVTSTTVTMDAGISPPSDGGVEVRYSDSAWGTGNNRNLVGRFADRSFTLPRYARSQNYFLRSYDSSSPPKYSRYSMALHVDFPLDYTYES